MFECDRVCDFQFTAVGRGIAMLPQDPCHLLHIFPQFEVGGVQLRFVKIANKFGLRYRHTIVSMDGDYSCRSRLAPELAVTLLEVPVRKGRSLSLTNLGTFRRTLHQVRPDILLTYNFGAIEWALAHRLSPICRHFHFEDGFGPEEANGKMLPRRLWFRRIALTGPTTVIVPSKALYRIATEIWRLNPHRVLHIANGIDCARFRCRPDPVMLRRLKIDENELVIGTVGTLRPEKNLVRLLRIFSNLPSNLPVRLLIIGDGPERAKLEYAVAGFGLTNRVIFAGAISNPEVLLSRADVFVMSSDTEQMPLCLLEAMAAGLPVVSTDVGDIGSIVSKENKDFIIPKDEPKKYLECLLYLLNHSEDRHRIGLANHRRATLEFDENKMFSYYDGLFGKGNADHLSDLEWPISDICSLQDNSSMSE